MTTSEQQRYKVHNYAVANPAKETYRLHQIAHMGRLAVVHFGMSSLRFPEPDESGKKHPPPG